jgi:hypothetical protein
LLDSGDHQRAMTNTVNHAHIAQIPLFCMAVLSGLADIMILGTYFLSRDARGSIMVRMITWFALADLLGEIFISISLVANVDDGPMCTLQAAVNWYSVWSSIAWTMAFAHAVRICFSSAVATHQIEARRRDLEQIEEGVERRWHWFCWVVPLAFAVGIASSGNFGARDGMPVCTFRHEALALVANTPLYVVLLYNVVVYVSVHQLVHKVMHVTSGLLAPETRDALERRVRVWPRFTAYILTFIASQTPGCAFLVIDVVVGRHPPWMDTLLVVANALSQSHGLLNGLVFFATNPSLLRQCWDASARRADEDGPLCADEPSARGCWPCRLPWADRASQQDLTRASSVYSAPPWLVGSGGFFSGSPRPTNQVHAADGRPNQV